MLIQQLVCRSRLALVMTLLAIMMAGSHVADGQEYQAGDIVTDEFGVEMVYVPGATFTMGIEAERLRELCEQVADPNPENCVRYVQEMTGATYLQTVEIQPFWIDRFEVTIELFSEFCTSALTPVGDCIGAPPDAELALNLRQPQHSVSWYAADYVCSLRYARLPTEAEWEYAASGPDKSAFAWGDTFVADYVEHVDSQYVYSYPVGTIPENRSWVGAYDMTGNLKEWVEDRFGTRILSSDSQSPQFPVRLFPVEVFRVTKGGYWDSPPLNLANFFREYTSPETMSTRTGFRCARSVLP